MTIKHLMKTGLFTGAVFLSSCAYMQTHKNIEETGREHTGYQLNSEMQLYRAGGDYYLAVEQQRLRMHYPAIYDSIFLIQNNEPEFIQIGNDQTRVYHKISAGTATVLQREDGYAELSVLSDELRNNDTGWLKTLPAGAQSCSIKADIAGTATTWAEPGSGTEVSTSMQILSTLDEVIIDWPGTILYNLAIPVMAPFVFFHEFLDEK